MRRRARGCHSPQIVERAYAARCLHAHQRADGGAHQRDIVRRGARGAESGGRLDVIGAGLFRKHAGQRLFRIRQQRGFDDHLHDGAALMRNPHYAFDIRAHRIAIARFQCADVDHHIDLARALTHGRPCLGGLGFGTRSAQRETGHGANLHRRTGKFRPHQRNPISVDAHAREAILPRLAAHLHDIGACCVGL